MLFYVILSAIIILGCAQEHFTCTRQQGPPNNSSEGNIPIGEKGAKGEKGESGLADESVVEELKGEISLLRDLLQETSSSLSGEISLLQQNLQETREFFTASLRDGFVRLDGGWVGLFNGYQYKLTRFDQFYENNKVECERMGANLAVYGIQDMTNRRILKRALHLRIFADMYIGLNDIDTEGDWRWETGGKPTNATALWAPGEPDGHQDNADCAIISFSYDLLTRDYHCRYNTNAICEKPWVA